LKNCLALSVIDTGVGIDEEKIQYIFESFRQVDGTITRKAGGTGLGLTITKRFSELLQGNVDVGSKLGEGTRFTLTIPLKVKDVTGEKDTLC